MGLSIIAHTGLLMVSLFISAWAYTVVRSSGHGNSHGLGVWNGQHAVQAFFVSLLPLIAKDCKPI